MPRITIDVPPTLAFSTELQVYVGHINEAGHVDNAQLLTLVSEARQRFFQSLGYTQTDVEGVGIVIADAAIQYLSEAVHGETLVIAMGAHEFNKYGCDLVYRIRDKASGRDVARGKTGIVFFDYARRKIAPLPQAFHDKAAATAG
ncbi:MAG TPA: thioesterase family protein [Rhodocyclaceae bacterium]|nr:thioesterase family protein [Rhodocyclaceae bacterium]